MAYKHFFVLLVDGLPPAVGNHPTRNWKRTRRRKQMRRGTSRAKTKTKTTKASNSKKMDNMKTEETNTAKTTNIRKTKTNKKTNAKQDEDCTRTWQRKTCKNKTRRRGRRSPVSPLLLPGPSWPRTRVTHPPPRPPKTRPFLASFFVSVFGSTSVPKGALLDPLLATQIGPRSSQDMS